MRKRSYSLLVKWDGEDKLKGIGNNKTKMQRNWEEKKKKTIPNNVASKREKKTCKNKNEATVW